MRDTGEAQMIKLGPNLLVPIDKVPHDLRRRWDMAQAKLANGDETVRGAIKTIMRDIAVALGPETLIRACQRAPTSMLDLGVAEKGDDAGPLSAARSNAAAMKPLSEEADEEADKEKRKEGIKERAGRRPGK